MQSELRIRRLDSLAEMLAMWPLIHQLNAQMTEERYAKLLGAIVEQGNYFQVACYQGDSCVGLTGVWIGTQLWCGRYLEVDNFIVDRDHRGSGVGQYLLEWAEDCARREGCEMMRLDTYVTMERAQKFYFAHGFKIEGFHMTKRL